MGGDRVSAAHDAATGMADGAHRGSRRWSVEVRRTPTGAPGVTAAERPAADLRVCLAQDPPSIPPTWSYDDKGSLLLDAITRLEEYDASATGHPGPAPGGVPSLLQIVCKCV